MLIANLQYIAHKFYVHHPSFGLTYKISISFPETSKSPQQKPSPVMALEAKGGQVKTLKKTPQKNPPTINGKTRGIR